MPRLKIGTDNIYYVDVAGPAMDSPVILWGHGFLLSGEFYASVVAAMPAFRHVVVDHRGHGRSSDVATEGTLDRMADDMLCIAASLGIERFVYAGHSMGAAIGWRVAAKRPHAVLAGVSIAGIPVNGKLSEAHEWVLTMIDMAGNAQVMTDMIAPLYHHDPAPASVAGASAARVPRSIIRDIVTDQFHLDEHARLLPMLRQPWLFLIPSDDLAEPAWYQAEKAKLLPRADAVMLEGEGHLVPQERPRRVAAEMNRFLLSQDLAAE